MKTLKVLTAAAGILLAVTAPTLASAKERVHRGYNAYASDAVNVDRSGAYGYGPIGGGKPVLTPLQHNYNAASPIGNLPYPDRAYGDPDRW